MVNEQLWKRMDRIQTILVRGMYAGSGISAASRGNERELLIDRFLHKVLPPSTVSAWRCNRL
jgi:hypothetical protein